MPVYTINKARTNYNNAIINLASSIRKINGQDVQDKRWPCTYLATLLASRNEEFSIETCAADAETTSGVLPPLSNDKLQTLVATSSAEDQITSASYAKMIREYFTEEKAISGYDLNVNPEKIKGLTEDQALLILNNLTNDNLVAGAIAFPQHHKILFQMKHDKYSNYLLDFSGNEDGFRKMTILVLNIDTGFRLLLDPGETLDKELQVELNKLFKAWSGEDNDYQGRLIPENKSGFKYNTPETSMTDSTALVSNFSFLKPAASPLPPVLGVAQLLKPM